LNVDWDGAHKAYGLDRPDDGARRFPLQKGLTPLESPPTGSLRNARRGTTADWVGLVAMTRAEAINVLRTNYPGFAGMAGRDQETVLSQFLDTRTNTPFGSLEDLPGNGRFPIVQLPEMGQPKVGYYVSQSPAFDRSKKPINLWDQNIYLDAGEVPYSVVPRIPGVNAGDFGLIIRNATGASTAFLYGDTGAKGGSSKLGECSGYVYQKLTWSTSNDETFSFIIFPGSGNGVADPAAVKKMEGVVRAQMGKLFDADDSLGRKLAEDDDEYRPINMALRDWGGPQFSGAADHGGSEGRGQDLPDGRY
jgi:hypothetical protein